MLPQDTTTAQWGDTAMWCQWGDTAMWCEERHRDSHGGTHQKTVEICRHESCDLLDAVVQKLLRRRPIAKIEVGRTHDHRQQLEIVHGQFERRAAPERPAHQIAPTASVDDC